MRAKQILRNGWLFAVLLLLGGVGFSVMDSLSNPPSLPWEKTFTVALARAKAENKPIMIDFWAPWCGWCKKLDSTTYRDSNILRLSNDFVCVKINADVETDIAAKYRVDGLPTISFVTPEGRLIQSYMGYRRPDELAPLMQQVLEERKKG